MQSPPKSLKTRTLGQRLAQERRLKSVEEERDIGHQEIADAAGVSQPTYSRYEADATKPDDDTLARLADYFGVTRGWLRFGEGERKPLVTLGMVPKPERTKEAPGDAGQGDSPRKRHHSK
jgi:transcriptional regulator with XRE-family HTH domain